MAASVTPDACEDLCVKGIVTLSKDRVWAVRVAAAAAVPSIAVGKTFPSILRLPEQQHPSLPSVLPPSALYVSVGQVMSWKSAVALENF